MKRKKVLATALAICLCGPSLVFAQSDDNAAFFAKIYWGFCESNGKNADVLRAKLKATPLPELPSENARRFLAGAQGDAWPVPHNGAIGNFVLALPAGKNLCAVYARRADAQTVEQLFAQLANTAPVPIVVEKRPDTYAETVPNGKTHTISYVWSSPGEHTKLLFMLTTATSVTAELQAMGTVSLLVDPAN